MNEVIVELEERSYPIFVGNGLLKTIDGLIGEHLAGRSVCIVTDSNLKERFLPDVERSLSRCARAVHRCVFPVRFLHSTAKKYFVNMPKRS